MMWQTGRTDGKPYFREHIQNLRNTAFRSFLNVGDEETGVAIVYANNDNRDDYPLAEGDVLTHVGPHDLDNDGMVQLDGGIRLLFQYFVPKLTENGSMPITILRDGKKMELQIPIGSLPPKLMEPLKGQYPKYFVYGPAVFVEANTDFLDSYLQAMVSADPNIQVRVAGFLRGFIRAGSPLVKRAAENSESERLVVLASPLLPHKISKGYAGFNALVLKSINGIAVTSIDK